jgi:prophage regulatory protein
MVIKSVASPSSQDTGYPRVERRIIRRRQVQEITGLKKSAIYAMEKEGFPKRVKLGVKAVGWVESEVADWVDGRVKASRQPGVEGA